MSSAALPFMDNTVRYIMPYSLLFQAGIPGKLLTIALEPEAASLFCMHIPVGDLNVSGVSLSQSQLSPFATGTRYMVVDVGGKVSIFDLY